jgi:hypothetical protein
MLETDHSRTSACAGKRSERENNAILDFHYDQPNFLIIFPNTFTMMKTRGIRYVFAGS